ncbi:tRNA 2-selenouridine(34) synthase MnmH [Szabonella alba]|uniref:tRNA 2-selenouridine(34) synthase MnmH n=1 Tax=Szabonella alba TaxID=2804194 RepID=A0A8K0VAF6_9RHOB|nr:tRNA 2-selenouridine(34) synthase MnmH [Szabonella alba]MBL4918308.1 tRNA 2-selenouridine(34) synthase MnmH [Szabonella alba]
MPVTLTALSDLRQLGFDDVIDVRSPSEYAQDHLPGAISLPVLDDEERARVGTIYKQVSPFDARKIGAALVARNAARHIEEVLIDRPGGWRPLVYCWRGGQRSGSFATILGQIGWRAETISGGYKAWRRLVLGALYERPFATPVVLLDGNTGSGKTELLHLLRGMSTQVLDLEALANHRGSIFGSMGVQPCQTGFEGQLAMACDVLDPARPVVIEAESGMIGRIKLPGPLLQAMRHAPRIEIMAERRTRARYLARSYADMTADSALLARAVDRLRPYQPATRIEGWHGLIAAGDFETLAADLMTWHYDPAYARSRKRIDGDAIRVEAAALDPEALKGLAATLVRDIAALSKP